MWVLAYISAREESIPRQLFSYSSGLAPGAWMPWTSAVCDRIFSLGYHVSFIQTPYFRQKKMKDKFLSAVTNCTRFHFCKSDQLPKLQVYLHLLMYVVYEIRTRNHIVSHDTDKPYLAPRHFRQLLSIRNIKNMTFPLTADNKLTSQQNSCGSIYKAGL